jgi:spore maturation protein CgeB
MKNILFVSNFYDGEVSYWVDSFKNKKSLTVEFEHLWLNKPKYGFIYRVFNKLNLELDVDYLNKRILRHIKSFNPDIVFIVKGNSIYPWTLKYIKYKYPNIKLVSFSNDNMCIWNNKSIYYHFGINFYDLVVSINISSYRKLEKFYYGRVLYIDKSYSEVHHKFIPVENKDYDCLFIGSYEKERFEIMKYLAENGVKVDIFGNMWNKAKTSDVSKNLTIHFKELVGDNYNHTLANAKVVLGFLRKVNLDTQTSRTFEIPACGGFMIMEYTKNQDRLFTEDKEMVYFRTKEELLHKAGYYIQHQSEAKTIVKNARLRCETDHYEYSYRIDEILKHCGLFK